MALDKQVNLFKVDTNAFLSEREKSYKDRLLYFQFYKRDLESTIKSIKKQNKDEFVEYEIKNLESRLSKLKAEIKKEEKIYKSSLIYNAKELVKYNNENKVKVVRKLDESFLSYTDKDGKKNPNIKNIVSMFESTLSRSFGIKTNELTYDIIIIEAYFFDILEDLILNGFEYNNKRYIYFSSSAGQIRKKKCVFVEEKKYKECENKLMCGLTIDKINENGGMNVNKYLAYRALSNSATELWEDVFKKPFNIDKTIVVDDFETSVKCVVDNIDIETYEITENIKQDMDIPHSDGCGIILSSYSDKNFMIRLPFLKGLLGSFDYVRFINENNCSSKVVDIWGKEYDVIEDDIQVIFTKSQLKMYKYYDNWDEYKDNFKKYQCEAGICNMEEDKIPNARINYQMLQTLYDVSDKEIEDLCRQSNKNILEISNSLENMLRFFGVRPDEDYEPRDSFQEALSVYPEILNDISCRSDLKDLKNSMVNAYRGGKLEVRGKFTFVLPDLYAFCEWLFCDINIPIGLLDDKEVFCRIYKNSKELDCLRSPSLYIEHAIRNNVCNKKYRNQKLEDWFKTDAIYISTHDLISRILQLDVDGDKLLVLAQKSLIDIAKRHMDGINPLYYEMKKANAMEINSNNIFEGLRLAFIGGNIGGISNDITKIWAENNTNEEKLKAVRWLCMETNFTIDYAKTLFKPNRPQEVDEILKKYHNEKVPYFFTYAKKKEAEKVNSKITDCTMHKIMKEIKDTRVMFNSIRNLGKIDYRMFLKNMECTYSNEEINNIYDEENRIYGYNLRIDSDNTDKNNIIAISNKVKNRMLEVEPNEYNIIQSLVKYLYEKNSSRKKKLLWYLFGEELSKNIRDNVDDSTSVCMQCGKRVDKAELIRHKCEKCRKKEIKELGGKKVIKCIDCGREFEVESMSRAKRCEECKEKHRNKQKLETWHKNKEKYKN